MSHYGDYTLWYNGGVWLAMGEPLRTLEEARARAVTAARDHRHYNPLHNGPAPFVLIRGADGYREEVPA